MAETKEDVNSFTKEQIAEYFCKRLGDKPNTPKWKKDYDRFMSWTIEKLRDEYRYVRRIHT